MPVNAQDERAIAYLCRRIRDETTGAGDWDEPGIVAAIAPHAAMTLAEVVRAVTRAAEDVTAKTPGVLRDTRNPCWRERSEQRTTPRNVPARERCGICGKSADHAIHADDHDFERLNTTKPCDATTDVEHLRGLVRTERRLAHD